MAVTRGDPGGTRTSRRKPRRAQNAWRPTGVKIGTARKIISPSSKRNRRKITV